MVGVGGGRATLLNIKIRPVHSAVNDAVKSENHFGSGGKGGGGSEGRGGGLGLPARAPPLYRYSPYWVL